MTKNKQICRGKQQLILGESLALVTSVIPQEMSLYSGVKYAEFYLSQDENALKKTSNLQGVADDVADKFIRGTKTIKKCNLKDHVAKSLTHKTAVMRRAKFFIVANFIISYWSFWCTQTSNFIDTFLEDKCSTSKSTY